MSFECPKCQETLSTEVRPVELEDGETVHILEDGTAVITSIVCDNKDCKGNGAEKPKQRRKTSSAPDEICAKCEGAPREAGHTGRHTVARAEA